MEPSDSPTGTRPVQFIFSTGNAQPVTIQPGDRRFWLVDAAHTVPLRIDDSDTDRLLQAWNNWLSRPLPTLADATVARAEQHAANQHASVTFARAWLDNELPLPVTPCTAEQLYRAFRFWCDLQGVRWPVDQRHFTSQVLAADLGAGCAPERLYESRTVRVWRPYGSSVQVAVHGIQEFGAALQRWLTSPRAPQQA